MSDGSPFPPSLVGILGKKELSPVTDNARKTLLRVSGYMYYLFFVHEFEEGIFFVKVVQYSIAGGGRYYVHIGKYIASIR